MSFDDDVFRQMLRFFEQRPERLAELQRVLLADGLLNLPEQVSLQLAQAQARTEGALRELAQAQARTEGALRELAQAQARTEQGLASLAARVDQLAEAQARTEQQLASLTARVDQLAGRMDQLTACVEQLTVQMQQLTARLDRLVEWQAGEHHRREGERYEHDLQRGALRLFAGGEGGAPFEPHVRPRLHQILADVLAAEEELDPQADPMLADVVWWKDGQFAVAEVSIVVGMSDVHRAEQRAATLRQAGPERGVEAVLPMVFGQRWSGSDARQAAERLGVAWWMGEHNDLSPALVAYRRLRPTRS